MVLIVGAGAFFGGMKYQETKAASGDHNQFGDGRQGFRQRAGNGNFQPVRGEITSSDESSITVKMQDGSSKIVILSDSTTITEAITAAKQSLTTGKQVMVIGSSNSDGSVTAQNIQLNPNFGGINNNRMPTQIP